jgi:3-dehydroquinate synthase
MKHMIHRCAELHLDHIAGGGDPFETGSARPLDFGHWAAHKLEQLSDFQISHGEAVAIGIALDVIYSRAIGLLDEQSAERILKLLEQLGFELFANELLNLGSDGQLQVLGGLNEFREHLGGELTITLLREIGRGVEVHEMNLPKVIAAIHELQERHAARDQKTIRAKA